MAIPSRARLLALAALALGCLCASGTAVAQTTYELTLDRATERLNAAKENAPIPVDQAFGDQHSLYDGTVTFSNVDISIPGNNALPVELRRTYSVMDRREMNGSLRATGQFGAMADWSLDLPNLHGTFAESTGWQVKTGVDGSTTARCSTTAPPPQVSVFTDDKYWDGYSLHIPGMGDQALLINNVSGAPRPSNSTTYPWITKSFWMISCKSTTKNGYPGEAFVATSPEGVKYTFDWVVTRETAGLTQAAPTLPTQHGLSRVTVYFLATRIEDRFGNWVAFAYSGSRLTGITSSDGRSITITAYEGDNVQIVDSDVGRWQYAYASGRLKTVTRPDGSTWDYGYDGVLRIDTESLNSGETPADPCRAGFAYAPPYTYTVTSPSKARGEFKFEVKRHWRQYVPRYCTHVYAGGPGYLKIPFQHDVFSLTEKRITGPGLSTMTWSYNYPGGYNQGCAPADFPGSCSTSKVMTVTRPDLSWEEHEFGVAFEHNEGQLLGKSTGAAGGPALQTIKYTYVDNATVASHPFVDRVGSDPRYYVGDRLSAASLRPMSKTTVSLSDEAGVPLGKYVTEIETFDAFARPCRVARRLQGTSSRTDTTAYYDDLTKWVLGQTKSITNQDTGKVLEKIDYYAASALPQYVHAFGLLRETRAYQTDGTLTSLKDGLLRETKLTSWYRGIPRTVTYPDLSKVLVEVDVAGNVRSITNEKSDKTIYDYDPMGRIKSVTYPADPNNWAVETTTRQFVSGELGMPADTWRVQRSIGQHRIRTYYDALMRPLLTEDTDEGAGTSTYSRATFDHRGLKIFQSYASASSTAASGMETTFDALGRARRTDTTDGVMLGTVDYLPGNRRLTRDARQISTTTTYQAFGDPAYELPTRIEAAEGQVTVIDRDLFGKMMAVTQSGGMTSVTRTLSYDTFERLCMRKDPESGSTLLGYDAASQLTWEAKGQAATACTTTKPASATRFVYWPRGWTKTVDYADASGDVSYTYELNGNVKTVKNPTATWTYGWNKRGLLESESVAIDGLTFLIDPEYNPRGDLKSLGYPGGRTVSLAPDASGRPTQLGSWIRAVKYHPNGTPWTFDVGTFGRYESTLNSRQWPELIRQWGGAAAAEMKFRYAYDPSGNVSVISDESPLADINASRSFLYDGLDRLWEASGPWGDRTYEYDGVNNIIGYRQATGNATYLYQDGTNRLNAVDGPGLTRTYAYNARGEVTSDGMFSFTRNNAGQITAIPGVGTYAYDGNGRRIKTVVNGRAEYSIYRKSGDLIQFYDATAAARTDLLQLQGKTLAEIRKVGATDTPTYVSVDLLGSPVVFTNANGQLISRESYGPYGEKLNDVDNVVGYTGHAHDYETGLTYAQARHYDGSIGRFLSPDPVQFQADAPASFNRYFYANNNPYLYSDPTGKFGEATALGCALSAAAGCAPGAAVGAVIDVAIFASAATLIWWLKEQSTDQEQPGEVAEPESGPQPGDKDSDQGCIYCVGGDKTSSGKDYVGSTDDMDRREGEKSDGRDRKGADRVDSYQKGDRVDRQNKEQKAMNERGGKEKLDNKRNEVAPKKWERRNIPTPTPGRS